MREEGRKEGERKAVKGHRHKVEDHVRAQKAAGLLSANERALQRNQPEHRKEIIFLQDLSVVHSKQQTNDCTKCPCQTLLSEFISYFCHPLFKNCLIVAFSLPTIPLKWFIVTSHLFETMAMSYYFCALIITSGLCISISIATTQVQATIMSLFKKRFILI